MVLSERQQKFLEFVKECHGTQLRKYTNEPYWTHPYAVAGIASRHEKHSLVIECALGHDLFEDTGCEHAELYEKLISIGYTEKDAGNICMTIYELTDQFTSECYPMLNRQLRKHRECERMGKVSPLAQSIKYADLIHNTSSIVQHDKNFAKVYLQEKKQLLDHMRNGNIDLLIECCVSLNNALKELK